MQEIIAGLEQFTFTFEKDVEMQKGTGLLPFQGMDKSGSAVCNFFAKGLCEKGKLCPLRHNRGEKMVVCKHWLRGLCKKGDQCNFLHQYDVTRMPECYFYSKFGDCNNKECPFLHVKPALKTRDCPWYDQGFCKDGPLCKHRHVRKIMCANYFVGFCPEGPRCQFAHPKMNLLFNPSFTKQLVNWPRGSAPPARAWEPRRPPSPPEGPLLPAQRPQQHLVSYHLGLRAPEPGPCYRVSSCGAIPFGSGKTTTLRSRGVNEGSERALVTPMLP
ncbi:putative cleavage and polyadenylation specificity factor subunit 4-like protein isoform X6 [Leopardus geoffroyi]|uniref:putative cleavage and polyadenylation specificity factor subunit 4-like protein isoform X6 n=1 Tax=Leopardus geoffroyi TaxID=46844 RepID=UPI001E265F18|nr:putative cleavage and polyadenylation specificity factor subunit 4-like protein isoform X6 [Leopardus geoffroyi]